MSLRLMKDLSDGFSFSLPALIHFQLCESIIPKGLQLLFREIFSGGRKTCWFVVISFSVGCWCLGCSEVLLSLASGSFILAVDTLS